ncbi:MAG: sulfatase-like hydrolase/transferase [Bilophila wadsworthia]
MWGLSDLDLFREAAAALTKSPKPFVAVIQTAGFHRPYTIPEDNAGFQIKEPSEAILKNYGFTGADEYNSLRFSDHSLGEFFKIARQQPWFDNTVFAIFGDHGLNDTSLNMSPAIWPAASEQPYAHAHLRARPRRCGQTAARRRRPPVRPAGHRLPRWRPSPESPTATTRWGGTSSIRIPSGMKCSSSGASESTVRLVENGYCYIRETDEHMYKMDAPYWRICSTRTPNAPPTCASTHRTSTTFPNIFCITIKNSTSS